MIQEADREPLKLYLDARLEGHDPAPPTLTVKKCLRAELQPIGSALIRVDDELRPRPPTCYRARATDRTMNVLLPQNTGSR